MENFGYKTFYYTWDDGDIERKKRLLEEDGYKILSTDYDHRAGRVEFKVVKVRGPKTSCGRFKIGDKVKCMGPTADSEGGVEGFVYGFPNRDGDPEDLIMVDTPYGYSFFKEKELDFCL